ncbi:hypothetical protein ES708_16003 [subsurface metagenome]
MKKRTIPIIITFVVLVTLFGFTQMAFAITDTASITDITTSVDLSGITVQGNISTGSDREVTIMAINPTGDIDYINQTTSETDGIFTFTYTPNVFYSGVYKVKIGGQDVTVPATVDVNVDRMLLADLQITSLKDSVAGLDIVDGIKNGLTVKLDQVLKLLKNVKEDKTSEAIEVLNSFIGQANDLRDEGVLTKEQAAKLITMAEETIINITSPR